MPVAAGFARSIYLTKEAAMRRPAFASLAKLERSHWLSRAETKAYQAMSLNQLLQSARDHSTWHTAHINIVRFEWTPPKDSR